MTRTFKLLFLMSVCLLGQQLTPSTQPLSGTINGNPISEKAFNPSRKLAVDKFVLNHQREPSADDEQEIEATMQSMRCDSLKTAISRAAKDEGMQRLGITVTQQDLVAARQAYPPRDPGTETTELHNRASAILSAISAVYDKHQSPDQVYKQMLANQIPQNLWTVYVHDAAAPDGRQSLEKYFNRDLTLSSTAIANGSGLLESWRKTAESIKLDEAVDQQIAATDPQFKAYLQERQASLQSHDLKYASVPSGHRKYLQQKRAEYWKLQVSKLDVSLSDPSLAQTCGLNSLGVQVAKR